MSIPPMQRITIVGKIMKLAPSTHEVLREEYVNDVDFGGVYQPLEQISLVETKENECHLQDGLLYNFGKLHIPQDKKIQCIRKVRTSRIVGHFHIGKTRVNSQRYVYWSKM
jgi:hypothetical protein